ncbi:DUF7848 domain-containing protein [Streptomyces zingiberis]|uniref:DUF7848 domain-containing protein n=1 Tax=Streptomyces zingiberis TaxID=2053010 RepID=A0ABX1BX77_9ACTN|nr:hypothetical protein [Streptomyces zingiberis]NJQ00337.1 hypothetical protein [Streptomyces zingiberis]
MSAETAHHHAGRALRPEPAPEAPHTVHAGAGRGRSSSASSDAEDGHSRAARHAALGPGHTGSRETARRFRRAVPAA